MASFLAKLLQISEQRRDRRMELNLAIRAYSEASTNMMNVDSDYYFEAFNVLNEMTVIDLHSVEEIDALMAVLNEYPRGEPYKLEKVKIYGGGAVAEMREALTDGGFVHLEGNTFAVPE